MAGRDRIDHRRAENSIAMGAPALPPAWSANRLAARPGPCRWRMEPGPKPRCFAQTGIVPPGASPCRQVPRLPATDAVRHEEREPKVSRGFQPGCGYQVKAKRSRGGRRALLPWSEAIRSPHGGHARAAADDYQRALAVPVTAAVVAALVLAKREGPHDRRHLGPVSGTCPGMNWPCASRDQRHPETLVEVSGIPLWTPGFSGAA